MKKILSMILALSMLLSMCISVSAAENWLLAPEDFTGSFDDSWGTNAPDTIKIENDSTHGDILNYQKGYLYTKNTMDTTNVKVIEFKFDINFIGTTTLYSTMGYHDTLQLNGNFDTMYKFVNSSNKAQIKYGDAIVSENNNKLNLGEWYTCTIKIDQRAYPVPVTLNMCNVNGEVVVTDSRTVYASRLKPREKADFVFYASGATGGLYLDNTSIRELTAYDLISYTPIIEENFDDVTSTNSYTLSRTNTSSDYYKPIEDDWYGGTSSSAKLYLLNGDGTTAQVKTISEESTDKVLEFDISESTCNVLGIMYLKEDMTDAAYVNEMTFTYTDAVESVSVRNNRLGDNGVLATLDFSDDIVAIGQEKSSYKKCNYNFTSGATYTVRAIYSKIDETKTIVKIEITDGNTSLMIFDTTDFTNYDNKTPHYPEYRFNINTENVKDGDKIIVKENNIYSTSALATDSRLSYSALALDKQSVESGDITVCVDVDFAPYFEGTDYVSDAKLIIATYADGALDGLKTESIKLNSGTYTTKLNVSSDATKVKAMLWDMGSGSVTPLAASVSIGQ